MLTIGYLDEDTYRVLEFDCVVSEGHEITSTLTEHPVERGADLSDHKRPGQRLLRLEGLVTNTPLGAPPLTGGDLSDVTASTQGVGASKSTVTVFSETFDRVTRMLDRLTDIAEGPHLLTVVTDVRTYEDAQVVGVVAPRTADDGDSVTFSIDIVQIRIADTQEVGAPVARFPRGRRSTDNGSQAAAEATGDTAAGRRQSSVLADLRDDEDTPAIVRRILGANL